MNCIMVLVVTYLVLLTVGAGLLLIQGKRPESCLLLPWVTMWTHLTENSGSGESPGATAAHLLGESSQALGDQGGGGGGESRKGSVCYVLHVCVYVCVEGEGRQGEIDHTYVCLEHKEGSDFTQVCLMHLTSRIPSLWEEGALSVCLFFNLFILIGG